jgi:hypothetical protein
MDFDEIMEMLITELTERGIREYRKENSDTDLLMNELVALSEKVQKCLLALDEQARSDFEHYINLIKTIADNQMRYLYIQGAKDCGRLLKSFEII